MYVKGILVFLAANILCSYAASDLVDIKVVENFRIDRIEALLTVQNERIRTLQNIVIGQKNEIQNLRGEVSKLKSKDRVNERKLSRLADILARSSHKMTGTTVVTSGYAKDGKMFEIQKQNMSLDKGKRMLAGNVITTPVPKKKAVTAFYAYLSKQESTPGTHHTLIFDTVITNENNGYHPFTGTFIVPEIGIYVFTFSIRLTCHGFGPYEIVKNTEVIGVVYSDISRVCIADHITGTIVIHANQGDEIYVRTHATGQHGGIIFSDHSGRSSFAGWRISE